MNLLGTSRATRSPDFVSRVQAAIVLSAQDILNSGLGPESNRYNAAVEVMRVPESHPWLNQFLWRCAANAAIASTVQDDGTVAATDSDIVYVVSGAWHDLFPDPAPAA